VDSNTASTFFQGFECDDSFFVPAGGAGRVASHGGFNENILAASGNYYLEVHNLIDGYRDPSGNPVSGIGDGGYTFFSGRGTVGVGGDFYQSIDVYVDVNWGVGTFELDMTPNGTNKWDAEHQFLVNGTGAGHVDVTTGGVPVASITQSGWYTFQMTWEHGAVSHLSVLNASGAVVGTVVAATNGGYDGTNMQGNGYIWLTYWTNGFADDRLSIDNLMTGVLPRVAP